MNELRREFLRAKGLDDFERPLPLLPPPWKYNRKDHSWEHPSGVRACHWRLTGPGGAAYLAEKWRNCE